MKQMEIMEVLKEITAEFLNKIERELSYIIDSQYRNNFIWSLYDNLTEEELSMTEEELKDSIKDYLNDTKYHIVEYFEEERYKAIYSLIYRTYESELENLEAEGKILVGELDLLDLKDYIENTVYTLIEEKFIIGYNEIDEEVIREDILGLYILK